jgi:1-aminocyclopropane-1-carboxylate deaminase
MLNYKETPIQEILDVHTEKAGVHLLMKREDLNHPLVSGNKWWKLK